MKRAIFSILGISLIITLLAPQAIVWSKRAFTEEPTFHPVIQGEYLSKISLRYYGTAKYWRELALINRAPNSDRVFPGERIFIPSQQVIQALHEARSSSKVNRLVQSAEKRYAELQFSEKALYHIKNDTLANLDAFLAQDQRQTEKKLSFPIIIAGFSGLLLGGVMMVVISQKKRHANDTIEPDYEKYRTNRSKRVYV